VFLSATNQTGFEIVLPDFLPMTLSLIRVQKRRVSELRTSPYPINARPRQQGRLRAAPHGGRYRTFFDGHVLGVRGGDPRLAGDDITVAKYYDFDKGFLIEQEQCSTHYDVRQLIGNRQEVNGSHKGSHRISATTPRKQILRLTPNLA
jgi:hypothetical protein